VLLKEDLTLLMSKLAKQLGISKVTIWKHLKKFRKIIGGKLKLIESRFHTFYDKYNFATTTAEIILKLGWEILSLLILQTLSDYHLFHSMQN